MRISDWSSDVCSSDLIPAFRHSACKAADAIPIGQVKRRDGGAAPRCMDAFLDLFQTSGSAGGDDDMRARASQGFGDRRPAATACTSNEGQFSSTGFLVRKSVVSGKSVAVRVDLGGRRTIKKKKKYKQHA